MPRKIAKPITDYTIFQITAENQNGAGQETVSPKMSLYNARNFLIRNPLIVKYNQSRGWQLWWGDMKWDILAEMFVVK